MKKNSKLKFLLPMLLLGLSGCDIHITIPFGSNKTSLLPVSSEPISIPSVDRSDDYTSREPISAVDKGKGYEKAANVKYTLRDSNEQLGWNTLNSTGNQKLLIVPVQIKGATSWNSTMLTNLEKAFFGYSIDTNWQSVRTFFQESSYGKLHLSGEITGVLQINDYTVSSLNNEGENASEIVADKFNNSNLVSSAKRKEYDQDGDGYIDATIFVYSNAYENSDSTAYWAWCINASQAPNTNTPSVNNYMWVSYTFSEDTYESSRAPQGIDTHTFIHEMGHILGLDDYYCYDSDTPWDSAGDRDMQSYNIGDHNIYSKMASGWVKPYVVTDSCEIQLRTSALYDDAILIKDNWNGSIFDEYLLIEFYTPQSMNEQDSKYQYNGRNYMYDYSGLRIYHVDARLVRNIKSNQKWNGSYEITNGGYTSDFVKNETCYVGASNSISYQYLTSSQNRNNYIRYLHLIDKGGNNTLKAGTSSSWGSSSTKIEAESTLWTVGDTFTATDAYFAKGKNKFNDGTTVGYSVKVSNISGDVATVVITKN